MASPHFPFTEVQLFDIQIFIITKQQLIVYNLVLNCIFQIISEFLIPKDKPVSHFKRRQPNMLSMQVNHFKSLVHHIYELGSLSVSCDKHLNLFSRNLPMIRWSGQNTTPVKRF